MGRYLRWTSIILFSLAGSSALFCVWFLDRYRQRHEIAAEWLGRCYRVPPAITREELVQIFGQPTKEQPEPGGQRTILWFINPAFSGDFPRVYILNSKGRVDEIQCNIKKGFKMTPQLWKNWEDYQAYLRRKDAQNLTEGGIGEVNEAR